jgi:hypothetical protein
VDAVPPGITGRLPTCVFREERAGMLSRGGMDGSENLTIDIGPPFRWAGRIIPQIPVQTGIFCQPPLSRAEVLIEFKKVREQMS